MDDARTIAEKYFKAVGEGNVEEAVSLFAPEADFSTPTGPVPTPEGIRQMLGGYAQAFPENRFEVARAVSAGEDVVLEGFWIGKHTGPMALPNGSSIPATGRSVKVPFATLFRVKAGKIASHRAYWDMATFLGQLGLS